MSRFRKFLAVSFRAKVLMPMISVMICVLAITAWVVDQRITKQFETEATQSLATADEAFRALQDFRHKGLLLRFRDLPGQPLYKAAFQHAIQTHDALTLHEPLDRLLAQQGVDIVLFSAADQKMIANAKRDPLVSIADFENASAPVVKQALAGDEKSDIVQVGGKLYDVVSIPAPDPDGDLNGALTLGSEIGGSVASELSGFTHSQIVLLVDDQVIVSTIPSADSQGFAQLYQEISSGTGKTAGHLAIRKEMIGGEHYYCSGGHLATLDAAGHLGYLLLYSYEQPYRALETTQEVLLLASGLAILLGSAIVCFLVGKVTRPLRELRDNVEAVGRGDFSRRVKVRSEDECGELAHVFNQMTENLQNSREQLETTVETLKTTQAQLIQSEKLSGIGEFIAGVAHELNNPLTSVMGFSELLQKAEINPQYKRHLEMIHKSALRCQKIVQSLLGFARRTAPERKAVCLNRLVEAALEMLQYQLRTSNVETILNLEPRLPQAMVDPHQVQQVFLNLINNARQAIEAHQPKGWIKVTTASRGETIRVIIQDNGPGIAEENLSKIFDPFFTTKEVGKGTGLGLSLCYGIIKEHGGMITPRSRPGEGASFIIELPVTHEPGEAAEQTPPVHFDTTHVREGVGKRVLVIDDEESILQMVREALTPRGYEVDIASDGASGLQRMSEKQYDVALCDWKMPGLNGQQVYERARALNPALSSRMIFITGDVINERTRKFFEQQNKICLPKPFTIAEFRGAIKKVLAAP
jgi:two-component system, NtrC family, sensor kinase